MQKRDLEPDFVDEEEDEDCLGYSEDKDDEEQKQADLTFKSLSKNENQFLSQVNDLNEGAVVKIRQQKHKEALVLLQKAEKMLEFAASCGRAIDRNLIIVVLYNEACAYQCQWVLDRCSKYIDGVIYNLELSIKEEQAEILQSQSHSETVSRDMQSLTVKRQSFLARAYLQYCAILSQLGKHKAALENSKKAAQTMRELFKVAFEFCKEWRKRTDLSGSANSTLTKFTIKQRAISQKSSGQAPRNSHSKQDLADITINDQKFASERPVFYMKDEVTFAKLVVDQSYDTLKDMSNQDSLENMSISEKEQFNEAKKQLYFWRNNPENNEKHLRKELNVANAANDDDFRSLLGVQNVQEWIQNFNIGSIMHMIPLIYEEFQSYGEMIYEISKRVMLEKIIYLSISYFTIATEFRFIEIEKAKQQGITDKEIKTEEFRLSELYHLKAIEIACKYITCSSPYINHLITSYHKHYNQSLDVIEEESFTSQVEQSDTSYRQDKIQKLKQAQIQTQKDNQHLQESLIDTKQKQSKIQQQFNLKIQQIDQKPQQQPDKVLKLNDNSSKTELQRYLVNKEGKQITSPTSKLLQSFISNNKQTSFTQETNVPFMTPQGNNQILEQMLKTTTKKAQSPPGFGIQTSYSPFSKTASLIGNGKRDYSPIQAVGGGAVRTQTVPTLSFLQNSFQSSFQNNKQINNSSVEQDIKYRGNQDLSNSALSIQPQPYNQFNQLVSIYQPKSTRNQLNNLLAQNTTNRPSSQYQSKTNDNSQGYFSYRQMSGPQQQDSYRTDRGKDSSSPGSKYIQQRSPSQEEQRKAKEKKPQNLIQQRVANKPRVINNTPNQNHDKSLKDMSIPMRLETIQQLLKNNGQLMNMSKTNLNDKRRK